MFPVDSDTEPKPKTETKMKANRYDHINAAMDLVLACGPVGRDSIAREIRLQADNGNADNCYELADKAIEHGLKTGWLEVYDGMEDAYVMRRG